jgi:hypothetical protein
LDQGESAPFIYGIWNDVDGQFVFGIQEKTMEEMKLRRERDRAIREARQTKLALLLALLIVLAALVNGTEHNLRRQEETHREAIAAAANDDGEALSWMLRDQ